MDKLSLLQDKEELEKLRVLEKELRSQHKSEPEKDAILKTPKRKNVVFQPGVCFR